MVSMRVRGQQRAPSKLVLQNEPSNCRCNRSIMFVKWQQRRTEEEKWIKWLLELQKHRTGMTLRSNENSITLYWSASSARTWSGQCSLMLVMLCCTSSAPNVKLTYSVTATLRLYPFSPYQFSIKMYLYISWQFYVLMCWWPDPGNCWMSVDNKLKTPNDSELSLTFTSIVCTTNNAKYHIYHYETF